MFVLDVSEPHRVMLLRAMRAVALADGRETERERALLEAVRGALGLPAGEVAPLSSPAEVPSTLTAVERERLVQAMLLMALMDGAGHPDEAALVERFASHLGVSEPRVQNLRQLADGRLQFLKLDMTRKGYARDEFVQTARDEGLRGLYRTFGPIAGLATDHTLARRYNDLGTLPEGTLGRAYWRFIVDNGLGFPGEPGAVAARGTWHDLSHVLGGYPITPEGEVSVVAFIAGYRREDPFFWLFTIALQFQVGLRLSPFSPGLADRLDPHALVRHHRRGSLVRRDLSQPWDVWTDFPRPLDEVRRELNVVPVDEDPTPPAPSPCAAGRGGAE